MSTATDYTYILLNGQSIPYIANSTMKVVELVEFMQAYGWNPEELHTNFPHLSMSKIHAALAYYWDHKAQIDSEINQRDRYAAEMQQQAGESSIAQSLRAKGLLE